MSGDHNANQRPIKTYHALPLALRLADDIEAVAKTAWDDRSTRYKELNDAAACCAAAAELRRQHAEIAKLRGFAQEVRRTGDIRLASMAIAVLAQGERHEPNRQHYGCRRQIQTGGK